MSNKLTGLTVYVLRNHLGDCTNNGISSNHNTLTLIGAGVEGPFKPSEDRPAVTMVTRVIAGREYKHLVPCDENANPLPGWWMAGGNFAETSDSRFPNPYPLSIHDRKEF